MTRILRVWHARVWRAMSPLLVVVLLVVLWLTWGER
jgi:hypothetical protein